MLFNSIEYLFFLPIVLLIYRNVASWEYKKWVLLLAGLLFYGYGSIMHLLLLLGIIVTDYFIALAIQNSTSNGRKQILLTLGVVSNLGVLILFKYISFFYQIVDMLTGVAFSPAKSGIWNLVLPIGISFYTFQSIAYLLDVYKNKTKAETNFPGFMLFISFFPQLVAGPIERAAHLAPQLRQLSNPSWQVIEQGVILILYGFFKKIFIADRLALYTEQVFSFPELYQGPHILLANLFFTFQIYCDFSGYTDIARGTARLFGVNLMLNFNKPYLSSSFREFWSRWHISLSNWFRDVLYIPLGGNKRSTNHTLFNLSIVFFFSGLWHGAGFNYILWGCYHGLLVIAERLFQPFKPKNKIYLATKTIIVFIVISAGWIFFAAGNWDNLTAAFNQLTKGWDNPYQSLNILQSKSFMIFSIVGCVGLMLWEIFERKIKNALQTQIKKPVLRYVWLIMVIQFLAWFGQFSGKQFIYFQF